MIILAGFIEVDPALREEFLRSKHEAVRSSREEPGCLAHAVSADPLEPGRVLVFERWADKEALAAHLTRVRSEAPPQNAVPVISRDIEQYTIASVGAVGS